MISVTDCPLRPKFETQAWFHKYGRWRVLHYLPHVIHHRPSRVGRADSHRDVFECWID
jgi:hypothetical protein